MHRNFNDLKTKTMEEKEMEIFTDIMRKCGVNTEKHTWSELEDMAKAMEEYHKAKLKLLGIGGVSKRFSSAEKMAEWLHNNYEEIALNNGWKTQEDCQVPFCDLPKENKQTMIKVCERFLNVC